MGAELTPQLFRQVYREAEPRVAHAKSLNVAARAPDSEWRAQVTNRARPPIPAGTHMADNAITAQLTPDEMFVAQAAGRSFTNVAAYLVAADAIRPLLNSERPTTVSGAGAQVNAIAAQLERAGEVR